MTNKEKVLKLREEGKSYDDIIKITGLSRSSISYHCRGSVKQSVKVTQDVLDSILLLKNQGVKYEDIGKLLNISRCTVNRYTTGKISLKNNIRVNTIIKDREAAKKKKQKCVDYKGGKCSICGYSKSLFSLDFHHIDPSIKEYNISRSTKSFENLKSELDKCVLVCRNCHGEIHEREGYHR